MSRSTYLRNKARRSGLWSALAFVAAVASAIFAHYFRLCEMALPMTACAFGSLVLIFTGIFKMLQAHDYLRSADRESYWEHRRYLDKFQHVERI